MTALRIGTAGWSIPSGQAEDFPGPGTHLERYAHRFNAVEINSSFYRPHRWATYRKWADSVPDTFRFSVKLPKSITHEKRLAGAEDILDRFQEEVAGLGEKFGVLLIQLPPSLAYSRDADRFMARLAPRFPALACEPRHPSWFTAEVDAVLAEHKIGRVAADPPPAAGADHIGGDRRTAYFRLHGAPRIYWSDYDAAALDRWQETARRASESGSDSWVIFDNTAAGFALRNAAALAS